MRGAVAARFWLYQRREPASLIYWAVVAVITAAVSASSVFGKQHHPAVIFASAILGAAFVGIFHANSAGLTGPPFVLEGTALARPRDLRAYFSGQNIVLSVIGAPLIIAICFALAAAVGRPGLGLETAPVVLAGLGAALALNNLFTVTLPHPMVKRTTSPMLVPAQRYGGYRLGIVFGTLAGTAVAATPAIIAALQTATDPLAVRIGVLMPCSAIYGFALTLAGVRLAAGPAAGKMPELCQAAIRSAMS